ncbi:MAG: DUF1902 domain-containing protein [Candidatus Dadabacteria bacterium]|nr:DUF1902 domain-containing protein [Candidatus Dadabacteria bacterium]
MDNMENLIFDIAWDDEANVWYTEETPIPGVVAEANTIDELQKKLSVIISEISDISLESSDFNKSKSAPVPYVIKSIQMTQMKSV